jgi:hypothetical protein
LRSRSDFGYGDVYEDGVDIGDPDVTAETATRSIIFYRYYDSASRLFGTGKTSKTSSVTLWHIRCGLVCPAFLQDANSMWKMSMRREELLNASLYGVKMTVSTRGSSEPPDFPPG